jgi:hypothetical protein
VLERTAAAKGISEVEITHAMCSSKLERLAGLRAGHAEVGWCAAIREKVPARAAAVRSAAAAKCAEAMQRGVVYASWDAVVGDQFIFVAGDYKQIGPLSPRGVRTQRDR